MADKTFVPVKPFDRPWARGGDAKATREMKNFIKAAMFSVGPDGITEDALRSRVAAMVEASEMAQTTAAAWECVRKGWVAAEKGDDGEWLFTSMENPPEVPS